MERARSAQISLAIDWAGVVAFGLGAIGVTAVAASDGGYFPESWAWLSALTLFPAALVLIATDRIRLSGLETAFLALLLAFGAWTLLSATWSVSVTSSVFEAQRTLAYLGTALLLLLVLTRRTATFLLAGALAGVTAVATFACLTRVLPDRFSAFDSVAGYRLSDPIGYWNGLGIFSAMGVLLALGFAARTRSPLVRAVVSALPVVLVSTLYFTFSRGAWIALAFALVVTVAADPRRLRLALTGIALAPWSILAVWLAARSDALTVVGSPLPAATSEGHSFLRAMLLLSVVSGAVGLLLARADLRISVGVRTRRVFGASLLGLAAATFVLVWAQWGSPYTIGTKAWDQFRAPPKGVSGGDLNSRLFDLSANGRLQHWSVARDDFENHPLAGRGAGTFQYSWAERRPSGVTVRDAHSFYAEVLGELGIIGLLLVVAVFAVPLAAAARARHSAVFPGALGAYSAYVLHTGVDWDWELAGVTLVALISGVCLLGAGRPEGDGAPRSLRFVAVPLALVLSALAFMSVLGNVPLGRSREALDAFRWTEAAADARAAHRWAPWSSEPLRLLGEAQLAAGHTTKARRSFLAGLDKDPANWQLWVDLALASTGQEQRSALGRARRLNPRSGQVQQLLAPP